MTDKRSYLKNLSVKFYDKQNFSMITKLINDSIKDNYGTKINKKDKEFILNKMKDTYSELKSNINKKIEIEENLKILNKHILGDALKELNEYYIDKKQNFDNKHQIVPRPSTSTAPKETANINESFEQLLINRNTDIIPNKQHSIPDFEDKRHLDSQFNHEKIPSSDKFYENENVDVEDKLKEIMEQRNDIIVPIKNPQNKTIEMEINDQLNEKKMESVKTTQHVDSMPEMPPNIIESTTEYATIDNSEQQVSDDLMMEELYEDNDNDDEEAYMSVNELVSTKINNPTIKPIKPVLEYESMHEELKQKHIVERNIINSSSDSYDAPPNELINKIDNLVTAFRGSSQNIDIDALISLNSEIVQKLSFINTTLTSKIEDTEIFQHKLENYLLEQLNNSKSSHSVMTNLITNYFDKLLTKFQDKKTDTKQEKYKKIYDTFDSFDYDKLNNFNLKFSTKNETSKIHINLMFIQFSKLLFNKIENEMVKIEIRLLDEHKTLFSKINTNGKYVLLENLYNDVLIFNNPSLLRDFVLNIKISDINGVPLHFKHDYYQISSVSPINLDQSLNKINPNEIEKSGIIKKSSIISFTDNHQLSIESDIYFKNFDISPKTCLDKLLDTNSILKINNENNIIIDLDTRNFNFDKLGKLYSSDMKGSICLDFFEDII